MDPCRGRNRRRKTGARSETGAGGKSRIWMMTTEIRGIQVPLQQTRPLTQDERREQEPERVGGGASEPRAERDPRLSLLTPMTFPSPFRRSIHDQVKQMRGGEGVCYDNEEEYSL